VSKDRPGQSDPVGGSGELTREIFELKEETLNFYHNYEWENEVMAAVERGDLEKAKRHVRKLVRFRSKTAVAGTTRKQMEYEVVALVTLIVRAAIRGGVKPDMAYALSDIFLHKIGMCERQEEYAEMGRAAIERFTTVVNEHRALADKDLKEGMRRIVATLRSRTHQKVTLVAFADEVGYSPKYLSAHFKREVGEGFNRVVARERIEEACRLLSDTEMSLVQIAVVLCFSSQSYFCKVFKKFTGMTPVQYKTTYYRK
jgi:YesN/AraC family two-component response regulator